ncbi:MAG: WG repeat-containing protein [Paludibacteraceae bacterium]|nr:WG repeat-containing protein [Paludibacteraceae bacterium]
MQDNKTKKWGFVSKGVWVIKPTFDDCDRYNSFSRVRNYAIVKKDGYWGSIDEKGNFISKPVFKSHL